jgi:hypothetical protein
MFPLVAGTRDVDRKDLKVIATSILLVLGTGSILAVGLDLAPPGLWTAFFGSDFTIAGQYNLPYLLALYAVTTIVYSLSVVIITFEMSYKIANTSWVQLAFSAIVIAGICRFHSSLREVILVQLVLMVMLLICVALPFLAGSRTSSRETPEVQSYPPLRLLRRVLEDEVIAGFLKSDFQLPAFCEYHAAHGDIVRNPNLDDPGENEKRRALLFLRHLALWKEIPTSTEWYEVELNASNLGQIRVFPRAQWRKLAHGDFSIAEVAKSMITSQHTVDAAFLTKIASIGDQLLQAEHGFGAVILIGLNNDGPLTVLDGNHRLVAALLAAPRRLERLRFFCGLSPRMNECCWYNTNLMTLFKYGRNVLARFVRNPESRLLRLLEVPGRSTPAARWQEGSSPPALAEVDDLRS